MQVFFFKYYQLSWWWYVPWADTEACSFTLVYCMLHKYFGLDVTAGNKKTRRILRSNYLKQHPLPCAGLRCSVCLRCSPWSHVYLDWGTYYRMLWLPISTQNKTCFFFCFKTKIWDNRYSDLVMGVRHRATTQGCSVWMKQCLNGLSYGVDTITVVSERRLVTSPVTLYNTKLLSFWLLFCDANPEWFCWPHFWGSRSAADSKYNCSCLTI